MNINKVDTLEIDFTATHKKKTASIPIFIVSWDDLFLILNKDLLVLHLVCSSINLKETDMCKKV